MKFKVHTPETAQPKSAEMLNAAQQKFGFTPNLLAVMAEAPALLKGYMTMAQIFGETSFTETERQIVLLETSYTNDCTYCMAAHSAISAMNNVPSDVVDALRANTPIADGKLEALRQFARSVVANKGYPTEAATAAFLAAGYGQQQVLEVILGIGFKTLSNYTNHITHTPLDEAFKPKEWQKASCSSGHCKAS